MRLGEDDTLLQMYARDNLIALEEEHEKGHGISQAFVVVREETTQVLNEAGVKEPVTKTHPHCIIHARDMWEALEMFDSEHRGRMWVPDKWETRSDLQIGVDRIENRGTTEVIRIYRMRKDQVLQRD